ncbi:peptide ABC transporter ATP-binding protein [bacterium (Candidatus Blackallbacteria) CG17_big_fil_post_rev_8_21_14_2_50_48_46]|uniref:Peptide ABC transporter ATP-binding protein n=1 Tax=bacterium (Candidatus Blackallbacteria) CG17_big_fil_post_rev_8_21_14_2_50_48_46 TaxID=2014261 RepID=A0A2M7G3T1_9BACT|nr:MAG: peptide ABC transporter ATP-binding protein [bacterium (Candidatus Blackallbacteria) CG18_big_fil_WC_8_21_14_2_50_49_26]PIW16530.1 MAG: peptide ABC transporter ATP-binding protein [bacterium (Candidatus Blackallbacteria) CG17_big_fil_post_rev_8_21_14_2_50_48_46]PIW46038.1 MAG: peptide ABC transporter ATP-binding protein [bacterium (Candidatus Blackallbacteria) CG13_big_fil_rev_8_21_14_2_50_49_14]
MAQEALLKVIDLATYFTTEEGTVKAVDGVDFEVRRGEVVGVVGESGCGKSITSMSVLRLIAKPQGKIVRGKILFEGQDLLALSEEDMRKIRGNKIALISQDPMTSLNPVLTVGEQIMEAIMLHQGLERDAAKTKAIEMLRKVGIPEPEKRVDQYPHQFSGGMRQRAIIAMALSCEPKLLIADEPTTALDVTIQAQILDLMREIKEKYNAGIIFITHDLGVVAEMCDFVCVMYAGKVVEATDVFTLFKTPSHPYTLGLLKSIPRLDEIKDRLDSIDGQPPSLSKLPKGCAFAPRCVEAKEICKQKEPELIRVGVNQFARCLMRDEWKAEEAQ